MLQCNVTSRTVLATKEKHNFLNTQKFKVNLGWQNKCHKTDYRC